MSFNLLAPYYRPMEFVLAGSLLQRCRTAFLPDAVHSRTALLLGEGPGRYLLELLRVNPHVRVTYVDSSAGMLAVAQEQVQRTGLSTAHIRFVCADWTQWEGEGGPFDLIATHFFFDCFRENELHALIAKVTAWASPKAQWVVSDFCLPPNGWRRIRAWLILRLAYAFFQIVTGLSASQIVPFGPLLESAGFQLLQRRTFNHQLLRAELWQRLDRAPVF